MTQTVIADVQMRPRRLGHANLFVGNLEHSMAFYNEVLGLEIVRLEPEIQAGFLTAGATHHDVGLMEVSRKPRIGLGGHVQVPTGRGHEPGLNHFGWEMENEAELVAAYRRAKENSVKVERTTNHQISHSVYMFDPDGNMNEFYADALENWRSIFNLDQEDLVSGHWDPEASPPDTKPKYATNPTITVVENAVFHPIRLTHSIMVARNFEAMREFYIRVGGLQVIEEEPNRFVTLRATTGEFDLALVRQHGELKPGLLLIAFQLSEHDDLSRCRENLQKAGIAIERELDLSDKRGIVLNDPDGVVVELYQKTGGKQPLTQLNVKPYLP